MKVTKLILFLALVFTVACGNSGIDDIVNKNMIARGGADKWKSNKNAAYGFNFQVSGIEMPIYIFKQGDEKINMQMGMGSMGLTTTINGNQGWNNVMSKIDTLKEESLAQTKFQLLTQYLLVEPVLLNWKEKGYSITQDGIEKVGKEDWYKLIVTDKNKKKFTVYVEKSSWLERRVDTEIKTKKTTSTLSIYLDNYKIVDGMQIPETLIIKMDTTETGKITLKDAKFNSNMNESLFMAPVIDTNQKAMHNNMHGMGK